MTAFPFSEPDREPEDDAIPVGYGTCRECKQGPFTWLHTGIRWRLVDDRNRFHVCTGVKPDDFDALPSKD